MLLRQGRLDEAADELRTALRILEVAVGPEHPSVAKTHNNLGGVLLSGGEYDEAAEHLRRSMELWVTIGGTDHPALANCRHNLGIALKEQGKLLEAEESLRAALAQRTEALGADHPEVARTRHVLGKTLLRLDRLDDAEAQFDAALEIREGKLGRDHPDSVDLLVRLAEVHRKRGDDAEALSVLEDAWARIGERDDIPRWQAEAAFPLAELLWDRGEHERAKTLAELAAEGFDVSETRAQHERAQAWLRAR